MLMRQPADLLQAALRRRGTLLLAQRRRVVRVALLRAELAPAGRPLLSLACHAALTASTASTAQPRAIALLRRLLPVRSAALPGPAPGSRCAWPRPKQLLRKAVRGAAAVGAGAALQDAARAEAAARQIGLRAPSPVAGAPDGALPCPSRMPASLPFSCPRPTSPLSLSHTDALWPPLLAGAPSKTAGAASGLLAAGALPFWCCGSGVRSGVGSGAAWGACPSSATALAPPERSPLSTLSRSCEA